MDQELDVKRAYEAVARILSRRERVEIEVRTIERRNKSTENVAQNEKSQS